MTHPSIKDPCIDIAKGICIVLMVIGHSGCPVILRTFIYLFHMPFFFFCSGFLFKIPSAIERPSAYLLRKLETLWIPFVVYSVIFLISHNLLYRLYVETNAYSKSDFISRALKIPLCFGNELLLGGFWFLRHLFYSNIIFILFLFFSRHLLSLSDIPRKVYLLWGIAFVAYFISYTLHLLTQSYTAYRAEWFNHSLLSFMTGSAARTFLSSRGYSLSNPLNIFPSTPKGDNLKPLIFLATSFVCLVCASIWSMRIKDHSSIYQPLLTYLFLAVGIFFIISLSHFIYVYFPKTAGRGFRFLGTFSLQILAWHFLAFKLVSAIFVMKNELPFRMIATHPIINQCSEHFGWVIYSVSALIIASSIGFFAQTIQKKLFAR